MDEQIILAVDEKGKFKGEYIPKSVGHTGKGKRHLAISVLLYNLKGQVLLQKRKHQIFDNIWDLTGATHPLHQDSKDESLEEATLRCLKTEWGIREIRGIRVIGAFNYFARYGKYCENEYCYLLVGECNGPLNLNPEGGYEYKWMDERIFLEDIKKNPKKYSPWAVEAAKIIRMKGDAS